MSRLRLSIDRLPELNLLIHGSGIDGSVTRHNSHQDAENIAYHYSHPWRNRLKSLNTYVWATTNPNLYTILAGFGSGATIHVKRDASNGFIPTSSTFLNSNNIIVGGAEGKVEQLRAAGETSRKVADTSTTSDGIKRSANIRRAKLDIN